LAAIASHPSCVIHAVLAHVGGTVVGSHPWRALVITGEKAGERRTGVGEWTLCSKKET
jgi:hypothetical protein